MKNPKKEAASRSFRIPPWPIALGVLAVLIVVPWLLLSEPTSSSAPQVGVSPTVQWTPLISRQHGFRITLPAPPQDLTPSMDLTREIQGTCPGLEFEATASQGFKVSARIFATHDKIFQLMGTQFSGSDENFRRTVDSFSFLGPGATGGRAPLREGSGQQVRRLPRHRPRGPGAAADTRC